MTFSASKAAKEFIIDISNQGFNKCSIGCKIVLAITIQVQLD